MVCCCYHASRFTAGEELYTPEDTLLNITQDDDDDDSEHNTKFPIMVIFLGVLIIILVITSIADGIQRQKRRVHHGSESGLDLIYGNDGEDPVIVIGE